MTTNSATLMVNAEVGFFVMLETHIDNSKTNNDIFNFDDNETETTTSLTNTVTINNTTTLMGNEELGYYIMFNNSNGSGRSCNFDNKVDTSFGDDENDFILNEIQQ